MQAPFPRRIEAALSPERLWRYRRPNVTEDEVDVIARYQWNMALCEALYPPLCNLEIALRNSLHFAIAAEFNNPFWFDANASILKLREQASVQKAIENLPPQRKPPQQRLTPGRVIAELPFGFWAALFYQYYDQKLWPKLLRPVFPYMHPRNRTRDRLFKRIDTLRSLRNRVFHYEPIWGNPGLRGYHEELIETVGWISPDLRETTLMIDRFPSVERLGPRPYREELVQLLDS